MTFALQLKKLVTAVGGTAPAALACGVTQQTINLWLRGSEPHRAAQTGAVALLKAEATKRRAR